MLTIVRGRFKSFSGAIPVNEKNPDQSSVEVRSTPRTSTQVLVIKALAKARRTQRTPAAARGRAGAGVAGKDRHRQAARNLELLVCAHPYRPRRRPPAGAPGKRHVVGLLTARLPDRASGQPATRIRTRIWARNLKPVRIKFLAKMR